MFRYTIPDTNIVLVMERKEHFPEHVHVRHQGKESLIGLGPYSAFSMRTDKSPVSSDAYKTALKFCDEHLDQLRSIFEANFLGCIAVEYIESLHAAAVPSL